MGIALAASGEARTQTMRAARSTTYGPPEALRVEEVPQPRIAEDQVLVRVRAASVNPYDWHLLRGDPWILRWYVGLRRPKGGNRPGVDMAGVVEAVGAHVSTFAVGDEVFGSCSATFAEYTVARERNLVAKPAKLPFEQAAAIPAAGVTALQAVRDYGAVKPGTRVLINGASGGVGTFAIQIAKAYGAHVTAVCSTRNLELVRSLGADDVVDYTVTDFTRGGPGYDVILDNVGNRSLFALRRALRRDGTLVGVAGGKGSRLLGGLLRKWRINKLNRFVAQRLVAFQATINKDDMTAVSQLIEDGAVTPVIDRTYPLSSAAEAIRYLESGHASGKVVIRV
jgi:NADPH:quinone reductase-like Zn-dependent oxidoreductase